MSYSVVFKTETTKQILSDTPINWKDALSFSEAYLEKTFPNWRNSFTILSLIHITSKNECDINGSVVLYKIIDVGTVEIIKI